MFKITGMSLKSGDDDPNGVRQLATFDYVDDLYEVKGAALIRFSSNGNVTISLPRLHRYTNRGAINSIRLKEKSGKLALEDAAIRTYVALGGDTSHLADSRQFALDDWPLDDKTPNPEAVKWLEPKDPWAHQRENHPLINLPPPINVTKRTEKAKRDDG